jgi:hypothetical protein
LTSAARRLLPSLRSWTASTSSARRLLPFPRSWTASTWSIRRLLPLLPPLDCFGFFNPKIASASAAR